MLTSNTLAKGMNQDSHPKFQPEGTYRFALNTVLETELGEPLVASSELGNEICAQGYPTTKTLIGHCLTENDDIIVFLADTVSSVHEIGIYNPVDCTYETVAKGSCLNFDPKYPVDAIFRIRNGCERVVNFTDRNNDYRVINISDTSELVDGSKNIITCKRLEYTRDFNYPCIRTALADFGDTGITEGIGGLELGVYYAFVRYLDHEFNPTDWFISTRGIPVADEPYKYLNANGSVSQYDGGSNNSESDYYVPKTNKRIQLQISSLDTTFKYVQFAIVKRTADDGGISGVDVLYPVPLMSSNLTYYYTGLDNQIQSETTIDDVLSMRQRADVVQAQEFVDNRLMLGGVATTYHDYSEYQKYASKIKVEWQKTSITSPITSHVKSVDYYMENADFMEDEVVALGIVYVHGNGQLSPVGHIPGRAPDVVTANAYNPHIGTAGVATDTLPWDTGNAYLGDTQATGSNKRWKNTSTAFAYGSGANSGQMGYWESTQTYPSITTCNDTPDTYWGEDWQGNTITTSTKIRHHRTPGPELKLGAGDAGSKVGITFSNVEYPDSSIVAHFFVYGDRTNDKTVLTKGVVVPLFKTDADGKIEFDASSIAPDQTGYSITTLPSTNLLDNKQYAFISAEGQFYDYYFQPTYFKVEKIYTDPNYSDPSPGGSVRNSTSTVTIDIDHNTHFERDITTNIFNFQTYDSPSTKNYKLEHTGWIPKANFGEKFGNTLYDPVRDNTIINNSINMNIQLLDTTGNLVRNHLDAGGYMYPDKILYGSLRVNSDPFSNLFEIDYKKMNSCKDLNRGLAATYTKYGGDTFAARNNYVDISYTQTGTADVDLTLETEAYLINFLSEESGMNPEFRHGSRTKEELYYLRYAYDHDHSKFRDYVDQKVYELYKKTQLDDDKFIFIQAPEAYEYNDSYTYMPSLEVYNALPFGYEFCKDCEESYPNRLFYSETDTLETSADKSRIIYPNNYRDLPATNGKITDLFTAFDQLYATTPNSLYLIPTRAQQITTDESTIYLGTGEVLSLAPRQMKTTEFAFGGLNFFKSRIATEYGVFYVDDISARPFLLSNQLTDLSLKGMRAFWQENGKVQYLDQYYRITGERYLAKSTTSDIGVGYISTYDPRYKRIIVHKRDFRLLPTYEYNLVLTLQDTDTPLIGGNTDADAFWFNGYNYYQNDSSGIPTKVTFNNTQYFQNLSFTLSYSFLTESWVSFHSYMPKYAMNGHRTFFTTQYFADGLESIFRHDAKTYQTYYGTKYDHIIDLVALQNPQEIKYCDNIVYHANVFSYDPSTEEYKKIEDRTFDKMIIYNSNQSTGEQDLNISDGLFRIDNDPNAAYVRRTDKNWRINNFRDKIINPEVSLWNKSWGALQSYPFEYIDKIPYIPNINMSSDLFESKRMRDYYTGIRLFFNPAEDIRIATDIVNTTYSNRNR